MEHDEIKITHTSSVRTKSAIKRFLIIPQSKIKQKSTIWKISQTRSAILKEFNSIFIKPQLINEMIEESNPCNQSINPCNQSIEGSINQSINRRLCRRVEAILSAFFYQPKKATSTKKIKLTFPPGDAPSANASISDATAADWPCRPVNPVPLLRDPLLHPHSHYSSPRRTGAPNPPAPIQRSTPTAARQSPIVAAAGQPFPAAATNSPPLPPPHHPCWCSPVDCSQLTSHPK